MALGAQGGRLRSFVFFHSSSSRLRFRIFHGTFHSDFLSSIIINMFRTTRFINHNLLHLHLVNYYRSRTDWSTRNKTGAPAGSGSLGGRNTKARLGFCWMFACLVLLVDGRAMHLYPFPLFTLSLLLARIHHLYNTSSKFHILIFTCTFCSLSDSCTIDFVRLYFDRMRRSIIRTLGIWR